MAATLQRNRRERQVLTGIIGAFGEGRFIPQLPNPTAAQLTQEVMRMLELRASTAVPHWAASRLATLWGATGTRVLRVFPIAAARKRGVQKKGYAVAIDSLELDEAPTPIGADQDLLAAIEGRRMLSVEAAGGRRRVLIPLVAADEVRYLLELSGAATNGAGGALADSLIEVLGAYYDLLVDAETDTLTRLSNRRILYSQVGAMLSRGPSPSYRRFIAVADIDHFKQVNDRFGHLYGDEILIHFARLMRETFRAGDLLYRFGGEEFVIVFGVTRHEDRGIGLERFRAAVESYQFPSVGRVTTSLGFTAIGELLVPATTLIDRADTAVYYAKRNGRNRVCEYEALVAEGAIKPAVPTAGGEATLF
jgi:diguanylate cyclase (GGDEF)-like protein